MKPEIINGDIIVDDRGSVMFIPGFNLHDEEIRRFYIVKNHQKNFVRAWHGHEHESKYLYMASGAALLYMFKPLSWEDPDGGQLLDSELPKMEGVVVSAPGGMVFIPAGYLHGTKTLTDDAIMIFFSTATTEESKADDYRFPARMWNPWEVEER